MDSLLRKYTVAWICPLAIERAAAESMLSEIHEAPTQTLGDDNIYTFGAIGGHNVVIAGLSDQGLTAANTVALQMLRTFGEGLRLRMLVGIGGGIPGRGRDIRLGDVVISKPDGTSGGVIQTDRGKQEHDGFRRTGQLNRPPRAMLQALEKLMATHERCEPMMKSYIAEALEKNERMRPRYRIPSSKDVLFHPNYTHKDRDRECTACCSINGKNCVFEQEPRTEPRLWLGNIASSNAVMKNGKMRDQALQEFDVLCFEMEAAGLMNDGFSCLVIRGIADYADSHKSTEWQRYAALTAAACAKELLLQVPPSM
jgi:nucleoside phosphorylase